MKVIFIPGNKPIDFTAWAKIEAPRILAELQAKKS